MADASEAAGDRKPAGAASGMAPGSEADIFAALHSLSSASPDVRAAAGAAVVRIAASKQKEFDAFRRKAGGAPARAGDGHLAADTSYALRRLARGLASSHAAARQGFAAALVTLVGAVPSISAADVLRELKEATSVGSSADKTEERNAMFARIFGGAAVARAGLIEPAGNSREAGDIVKGWGEAAASRSWMRPAATEALALALDARQVSRKAFEGHVAAAVARAAGGAPSLMTADGVSLCLAVADFAAATGAPVPKAAQRVVDAMGLGHAIPARLAASLSSSSGDMSLADAVIDGPGADGKAAAADAGGAAAATNEDEEEEAAVAGADGEGSAWARQRDAEAASATGGGSWAPHSPELLRLAFGTTSAAFPELHPAIARTLALFARAGVLRSDATATPDAFAAGALIPGAAAVAATVASGAGSVAAGLLMPPREAASAAFERWWRACIDEGLLRGSTERRATGLLAAAAAVRACPASLLPVVLSRRMCALVTAALGRRGGETKSAAKLLTESILAAAQARADAGDDACAEGDTAGDFATAAVLALVTRGHGRFDGRTGTQTVRTLRALMGPSALSSHARALMVVLASPGATDGAGPRRAWAAESLAACAHAAGERCRALEAAASSGVFSDEQAAEHAACSAAAAEVVAFLTVHLRYSVGSGDDDAAGRLSAGTGISREALIACPPLDDEDRAGIRSRLLSLTGDLVAMRAGAGAATGNPDAVIVPAQCAVRWLGAATTAVVVAEAAVKEAAAAGDADDDEEEEDDDEAEEEEDDDASSDAGASAATGGVTRAWSENPTAGPLRDGAAAAAEALSRLSGLSSVALADRRMLAAGAAGLALAAMSLTVESDEEEAEDTLDACAGLCAAVRDLIDEPARRALAAEASEVEAGSAADGDEIGAARLAAKKVLAGRIALSGKAAQGGEGTATVGAAAWARLRSVLAVIIAEEDEDEEAEEARDAFAGLADNALALLAAAGPSTASCLCIALRGLAPAVTMGGVSILTAAIAGKSTVSPASRGDDDEDGEEEDDDADDDGESTSGSGSSSGDDDDDEDDDEAEEDDDDDDDDDEDDDAASGGGKRARSGGDDSAAKRVRTEDAITPEQAEAEMAATDKAVAAMIAARRSANSEAVALARAERLFRVRAVALLEAVAAGVAGSPLVGVVMRPLTMATRSAARSARAATRSNRDSGATADTRALGEKVAGVLRRTARTRTERVGSSAEAEAIASALMAAVRGAAAADDGEEEEDDEREEGGAAARPAAAAAAPAQLRFDAASSGKDVVTEAVRWLVQAAAQTAWEATTGQPSDPTAPAEAFACLSRAARALGRVRPRAAASGLLPAEEALLSRALACASGAYLGRKGCPLSGAFFTALLRACPEAFWLALPFATAAAASPALAPMPFRRAEAWQWTATLFRQSVAAFRAPVCLVELPALPGASAASGGSAAAAMQDEALDAMFDGAPAPSSSSSSSSSSSAAAAAASGGKGKKRSKAAAAAPVAAALPAAVTAALAAPSSTKPGLAAVADAVLRAAASTCAASAASAPGALPAKRLRDTLAAVRAVGRAAGRSKAADGSTFALADLPSAGAMAAAAHALAGASSGAVQAAARACVSLLGGAKQAAPAAKAKAKASAKAKAPSADKQEAGAAREAKAKAPSADKKASKKASKKAKKSA
ncbi:hypothetical protein FNF31_07782 [Cafeteria roenbergensis]|uniref:Uncharacterized protein n=1 Tax=Cafeteria roenbergensis TaxID=33653 RepID=A0A5A8C0G3_CAFRO|nr:hypothetical protein FNF31_07782 [Cafeteria roenbergensis]